MISNPPFENFDGYVADLMRDLRVPGAAVSIVEKNRVVLSSGYGVRKLGGTEPVDADTMFAIGSVTKALTTTLVARLIDEGKISWDARVVDYLKDFQLFDRGSTELLTLRDVALHRTGLPSTSPLVRYELPFCGREAIARLRYLKPVYQFRSRYCYNDVVFAILSLCAETASGIEWTDLMDAKLFSLLSMNSSHMSTSRLKASANLASPHGFVDGVIQPVAFCEKGNTLAAASVNSNLNDITQFLLLHVNGGILDGKQVISEYNLKELYSPQQLIRRKKSDGILSTVRKIFQSSNSAAGEAWSGLGWDIEDFREHRVIRRSGAVPGMIAQLILIPEIEVGIAILCNSDVAGKEFLYALGSRIAEACFNLQPESKPDSSDSKVEKRTKLNENSEESVDLVLDQYVGKFCDPVVGDIEVSIDEGRLTLTYGNLLGDLKHRNSAEFQVTWRDPYMRQHEMRVVFSEKKQDTFNSLEIKGAGNFIRV